MDDRAKESETSAEKTEKKKYHAPRILYRERLEVIAAICSPAPPAKGDNLACPSGPLQS